MIQRKNKGLTFISSLIPGAGEMYMGFMKQGISIMVVFWGILLIATFFDFPALLYILPVVWFYSFFHTHNLYTMPEEEFCALEDDYIIQEKELGGLTKKFYNKAGATVLIIVGIVMLWNVIENYVIDMLSWLVPEYEGLYWSSALNKVPHLVISIFLIVLGIRMIKGKKKELEQEED